MGFLVFCDTDTNGNITDYVAGSMIIPDRQYGHFFYLAAEIDVSYYKLDISTNKLVLKEG